VVESADAAGMELSLCGEMAADLRSTALLVGLGLRCLSMSPRRVPAVKAKIRQLDLPAARRAAEECLKLGTAQEVADHLETRFGALVSS
jgi:phosphocarrier protein FPr